MTKILLLALAYALLGAAGLTLAIIPPGYASPVFPAAGLALVAVLWYGWQALPGVWLGALALNLAPLCLSGHCSPSAAAVALAIATGASVQAGAGAWLVNRRQGPAWRALEREQDAFAFLLLGGVLPCVVSASLSVTALAAAGLVEPAGVPFTWWTWYVGDTLGVLVFAPLTLCLLNPDALWRDRLRRLLIPMLATLGLAMLAFYGAARLDQQGQERRLQADGEVIAKQLADRDWVLAVATTADYRSRYRPWMAWAVGVVGLMFAALLQVLMLGMTGRTALIQRKNDALKASEEGIQRYRDHLAELVDERTSQLADANRFLRMLADHLPSMVAYWDRDERCRFANAVYTQWYGRTPESIIGGTLRELLGERIYEQSKHYIQAALSGETQQFERTLIKPDGSTGYTLANYIPDLASDCADTCAPDAVRGMVTLVTDITEIKAAQLELQRLNGELAEHSSRADAANQAKGAFLAQMSHEIRTPLNGIIGMTELALDAPLNPPVRESLGMIKHSGEALLSIINDILDFSKIEAGKLELEAVPLNLPDLVQRACDTLGPAARAKGMELTVMLDPQVPADLIGDPGRLRQVLLNLLSNALKFTERGRIGIRVQWCSRQERQVRLQFSVQDTGCGIAPDKQRLIFEPFSQEDASITRRYGGTGLGLSITSRLVQLMGGELWLDSTPGVGTTFYFTVVLDLAASPAPAASAPESAVNIPPTRVLRLLLVEDNLINQKVGVGMLKRLGHQVAIANNGQEALDQLAEQPFDLVLMDMQMPVMDGLEATRQLRAREAAQGLARTTVIAITANAMASDQAVCRAAGMDGFISKPLQAAALKAQLDLL
ncbi:ATP-binding protein [uncultured Thiodictyon sp.]|uniref:ATP-binding protein n=1 Tax=uncultured Thiodictyon sp. TaxID=1846217 RepID=UPI0025D4BC37|nr:ATP-binding protein [uncultured Thiodictyon sp.]